MSSDGTMTSNSTPSTGASVKKARRMKLPAPNAIVGGTLMMIQNVKRGDG